jgi:uncharacterized protein YjbK
MSVKEEIEIKLSLDESDYFRCRFFFDEKAEYQERLEQENFYFDTTERYFISRGAMLRVRCANRIFVLTIKERVQDKEGCFRCQETEYELDIPTKYPTLSGVNIKDVQLFLQTAFLPVVLPVEELVPLGTLYNRRDVWLWEGLKIELDKTDFGAHADFELECETEFPSEVSERLKVLFKTLGVAFVPQTKTKFRRFLEHNKLLSAELLNR